MLEELEDVRISMPKDHHIQQRVAVREASVVALHKEDLARNKEVPSWARRPACLSLPPSPLQAADGPMVAPHCGWQKQKDRAPGPPIPFSFACSKWPQHKSSAVLELPAVIRLSKKPDVPSETCSATTKFGLFSGSWPPAHSCASVRRTDRKQAGVTVTAEVPVQRQQNSGRVHWLPGSARAGKGSKGKNPQMVTETADVDLAWLRACPSNGQTFGVEATVLNPTQCLANVTRIPRHGRNDST